MDTRGKKVLSDIGTKIWTCTYVLTDTHIEMCGALAFKYVLKCDSWNSHFKF